MKTTLNKIRSHGPCEDGWKKLLTTLGKSKADDKELPILTVLDSNGLEDALWCLRAVDGYDREIRLFAVWCARQVEHLMTDPRYKKALDVAEAFANGQATEAELAAACAAAWDARAAVGDAAGSACAAAGDAACAAAGAAVKVAAGDAAGDAARAAARDAAEIAAGPAAETAARAAQEAKLREILA